MTVAFIRHGQTRWNAEGRMQGSTDIPLNDVGREQAREAAVTLGGSTGAPGGGAWDVIVSSPLERARETAAIIADGLGIELGRSYDSLVERHYGMSEGLTITDIRERWGALNDVPELEPIDSVVARGTTSLNQIAHEYPGRNVIVVCHGTLIRYTLGALSGQPIDQILNGSVSTLELTDDAWRVHSVNGVVLETLV